MGYGIVVKSFGKVPNNSDNNKELIEKKKNLLQEQFNKQAKSLTKNNKIIERETLKNEKNNINDKHKQQLKEFKNQIKVLKSEKTILNKKIKTLEKKNETYIKNNQKLNENIENINSELLEFRQKYVNLLAEFDLLKENYNNLRIEYGKFKHEMKESNSFRKIHRELERLSVENKQIRFSIGAKNNIIAKLIKDLDSLRMNKLDSYTEMYNKSIEKLENDKYSLAIENQKLRKRLEQYEPIINDKSEVAITKIDNDAETNPKYSLVEITEFTGLLQRINDKFCYKDYDGNIHENVDTTTYGLDDLKEVYCKVQYDKENDIYVVKDIYPFVKSKDELIGYLYEMNLRKNNELKFYKKRNSVKKEYANYESFDNQKVLVINSFNPSYYVAELNKYKLKVENFSTYEENPQKIIPKLKGYDIVICCTGTSRHYMNNLIENAEDYYIEDNVENPKYQFMESITLTNLLNRINYAIENLK